MIDATFAEVFMTFVAVGLGLSAGVFAVWVGAAIVQASLAWMAER